MAQSAYRIHIELSEDRNYTGELSVIDALDRSTLGPFDVSARAADSIAAENGNPTRSTLFPFGDPPTGTYRVVEIVPTGLGTQYRADLYGTLGAIELRSVAGDAALADACGRFSILIHGGGPSADGRLRVTSGHFRLGNDDLRALLTLVRSTDKTITVVCKDNLDRPSQCISIDEYDFDLSPLVAVRAGLRRHAELIKRSRNIVAFGEYTPENPRDLTPDNLDRGEVDVDSNKDTDGLVDEVGEAIYNNARELGIETAAQMGGVEVPEGAAWTEPAAAIAGGLYGAAELYNNGQTDAAIAAVESTLTDALPMIAGTAAAAAAAPSLVEATVVVGITAATAEITLSTAAIAVTAAAVTIGIAVVAEMTASKLTELTQKTLEKYHGH